MTSLTERLNEILPRLVSDEFLSGTSNPNYAGEFGYGRPMKGHGWQPWSNADLLKIMARQIATNAPVGADLRWFP